MAVKKILIVDDDVDLVEILKFELEREKYYVETAENGEKGLQKLVPPLPDLIVMDVTMPVMDGIDFFQKVKSNPDTKAIPVLVSTSAGELNETFRKLDIADFIEKPFNTGAFKTKIKFLLSEKKD